MKTLIATAVSSLLLMSYNTAAAPSTPSLDWSPQEYSFVDVDLESNGSYKDLVTAKDIVDIAIKWNAWSGDGGDNFKVFFDNQLVHQGTLAAGTKSGTITFPYTKAGRHTLTVALCEGDVCATSAGKPIVIADTDGGHLAPLTMDVDANNKSFATPVDTVVGAYFVEWGIYGRDFDVTNIPAHNLTHLLYGFIPICGPNESLKEIENGNSWRALQTACAGSQDYEVVIHDPWAAVQKTLPGIDQNDPIRGTYAQLMALKQRYPDLKILPSVGGWTLSDPFYAFTYKANRDTFVASMKQFLKTWKFYDGVDIDWEFPGGGGANSSLGSTSLDGQAYIDLMRELREMLDGLEAETGRTYELTSAIGMGYDKIEDVDYGQATQYMDYIFAMTYDFYGGWNNVTGHQTALYCGEHMSVGECDGTGLDDEGNPRKGPAYTADNGIQQLLAQGAPANKLVLGVAMYGRGWEGVTADKVTGDNPMTAQGTGKLTGTTAEGVWEAGIQDYKGMKATKLGADGLGINGFEARYDEQAQAAYVWNPSKGTLVTYDSPKSVNAKGHYVRSLGLAGLFAWEIDADNGDILNAMHEGLNSTDPVNRAPIVSLPSNFQVNSGESLNIEATASDPDQDPITISWQIPAEFNAVTNGASATLVAPSVQTDTQLEVSITVSDGIAQSSRVATVTVIAPTSGNQAPQLQPIANVSVAELSSVVISASASDADNDPLSFTWSMPTGLSVSGSGSQVTIETSEVTQDTDYVVTLTVSDGQEQVSQSFTVTVTDLATGDTTWSASTVYTGGDTVVYQGGKYRAKWWTKGDQPDQGGPWEALVDNGQPQSWAANKAYNGGDQVVHNGELYSAKWWTKGDEPGASNVWNKL